MLVCVVVQQQAEWGGSELLTWEETGRRGDIYLKRRCSLKSRTTAAGWRVGAKTNCKPHVLSDWAERKLRGKKTLSHSIQPDFRVTKRRGAVFTFALEGVFTKSRSVFVAVQATDVGWLRWCWLVHCYRRSVRDRLGLPADEQVDITALICLKVTVIWHLRLRNVIALVLGAVIWRQTFTMLQIILLTTTTTTNY